ncbi:formate dehydrogenase accessory sulfurtransferase FdhD [Planctomicrobium piriforme]|uniref:Sulfur carrier protein FdhD n=1 Tax=Planctomicrobium piriforme TaxID=1576369 RepID=A0A1I3TFV7_9PLAN|nr:formate dehydrogenase accessory sulfurtransferase FdhD [Planctomicrobium piriforme]SFJ68551.1 FdhD protein [Planctomicrobium piriforme]
MTAPADCSGACQPLHEPALAAVAVVRMLGEQAVPARDVLAVEEPLEIRLSYVRQGKRRARTIAITMRTPGNDRELAVGFLLTEGIIQSLHDVLVVHPCKRGNLVRVHLREDVAVDLGRLKRNFYTSSSCGVCGKTSVDAVRSCVVRTLPVGSPVVPAEIIHQLPHRLRSAQAVFDQTGGLHASALFTPGGDLLCLREDVGRHNALDKLIGSQLLTRKSLFSESILLVSGRASFELVQKAVMAGIPILAAVGAPSSLAVQLAAEHGQTLLGFVRQDRFNIYTGEQRIAQTLAPSLGGRSSC